MKDRDSEGRFRKGIIPHNKGKRFVHGGSFKKGHSINSGRKRIFSDEWKRNISLGHKWMHISPKTEFKKGIRYSIKTEFKKGFNPWNKLEFREPYPYAFNNQLKEQIRIRDNYRCQLCDITTEELCKNLAVHHIDFDKNNNLPSNLISLCGSCHGKVHCLNNLIWIRFFNNKLNSIRGKICSGV